MSGADPLPDLDLADPREARELALRIANEAARSPLYGALVVVLARRRPRRSVGVADLAAAFVAGGLDRWPRPVREALRAFVRDAYAPRRPARPARRRVTL